MNFRWYVSAKKRLADVLVRTDKPIMIQCKKRYRRPKKQFFLKHQNKNRSN